MSVEGRRAEMREIYKSIWEIRHYMLVALGSAKRPLLHAELVDTLPEKPGKKFRENAFSNPGYGSIGREMSDGYVETLMLDPGFVERCKLDSFRVGLKLTGLGESTLEDLLEKIDSDPSTLPHFNEVAEKAQGFIV